MRGEEERGEEFRRDEMTKEERAGLTLVLYASNDMLKTWNLSMYLQPEVDVSMHTASGMCCCFFSLSIHCSLQPTSQVLQAGACWNTYSIM